MRIMHCESTCEEPIRHVVQHALVRIYAKSYVAKAL